MADNKSRPQVPHTNDIISAPDIGAVGDRAVRDPVAIIGMACRFPGAPSVADFWELLRTSGDAVAPVSGPALSTRNGMVLPGGYLPDIDAFDAGYFGLSADEALRLDPQLRLLMEGTWDALEDAGLTAAGIAGTRTGVYTCAIPSGYWDLLRAAGVTDLHAIIGAGPWQVAAGRISYEFDLRGISMGIEATCATSLLAVHLACRALWAGEVEMAIVSAANLLIDAKISAMLANTGLLSSTGRCRFGDAAGDGYIRSEGVAAVVLKPYCRAVADGDLVRAVITGTSATSDGRSGRTRFSPGLSSQELMLRTAYADAGISPGTVDYVEAHGTGTPAGDPVELTALRRVLGAGRPAGEPCVVGSAKSNIGHCEPASGLVGLIKTTLAIQHRMIPATLHVDSPHPIVAHPDSTIRLATRAVGWPRRGRHATAGVSAFGVSGTNVHVVLGTPPAPRRRRRNRPVQSEPSGQAWLLPLSARDPGALRELAAGYLKPLAGLPADSADAADSVAGLRDLCFSAGARRTQHEFRLAVIGRTAVELADELRSFAAGAPRLHAAATGMPRVVFVFPGQGRTSRIGGAALLASYPSFAKRLRDCDRALRGEVGWSVQQRLDDGDELTSIADIQPVTWAVQVALAALWQDWGIGPDVLVGHSMGEIAAAAVSGALSLRDAAAVVCRRSKLLERLSGRGAMWSVRIGEAAAWQAIGPDAEHVCVGVVNSDDSVVLTGDRVATERVVERLRGQGVAARRLQVDVASHAPIVDELRPALLDGLRSIRPRPALIPMHSTVVERAVSGTELDGAYWADNMRSPVRFGPVLRSLLSPADDSARGTVFVEISAQPTLLWAVEDMLGSTGARAACVPSLRPDRGELESMLAALRTAYLSGSAPAWDRVYPGGRYVRLPAYPWNRSRYWPRIPDIAGSAQPAARQDAVLVPALPDSTASPSASTTSLAQLTGMVANRLADVLEITSRDIDPSRPLAGAGLDSLCALRLQERLHEEFGVRVQIRDLLGDSTLAGLSGKLYRQLTR